ncbi:MAG: hypothetical protein ACOZNI_23205 [Myxococcota bacterium]
MPLNEMPCTVCGARFRMVYGAMIHPADVLCDRCILAVYDGDLDEAALAARLQPRMGMGPDVLASAIADRGRRLRETMDDRADLVRALAQRADPR